MKPTYPYNYLLITAVLMGVISTAIAGGASLLSSAQAQDTAQTWPSKPIHAIVPFTAGSATDIVARAVFEPLSHELGQSIIVENRPGAGGMIGAGMVANTSHSDGYLLLVSSSSHTIIPALYSKVPYDTVQDFNGVIPLGSLPNVLVVSPSKGFHSVADLVAAAKAEPGTMTYASWKACTSPFAARRKPRPKS